MLHYDLPPLSLLVRLIGQVLQILFYQRAIFLRISFPLGLLDCGAITLRQAGKGAAARSWIAGAIGPA
jgi:hypothetical protein